MEKSFSFQWYPKDILSSARVAEMSMEEECAYRRALDYCWLNGDLPADPERLARIIGKGCSTTVATVVKDMFTPNPNNPSRLIHDRLEKERIKQAEWRRKSSEGGKKSAEARRKKAENKEDSENKVTDEEVKGGSTTVATVVDDCFQPNGNTPVSSFQFPTTNINIGGGKSPPTTANSPPRESKEDYLNRKQNEYPNLDVRAVYADFVGKCGSEKYPNLKNTRPAFDKWLATEEPPIEVVSSDGYKDPRTGQRLI